MDTIIINDKSHKPKNQKNPTPEKKTASNSPYVNNQFRFMYKFLSNHRGSMKSFTRLSASAPITNLLTSNLTCSRPTLRKLLPLALMNPVTVSDFKKIVNTHSTFPRCKFDGSVKTKKQNYRL